jgi:hypothetical protein
MKRLLSWLKWMPFLWLTLVTWMSWGFSALDEVGLVIPFHRIVSREPILQHFDVVFVFLFYGLALLNYNWRKGYAIKCWKWQIFAWGFIIVGLISSMINNSPLQAAGGMILSLGRNSIFWAGLTFVDWNDEQRSKTFQFFYAIVVVNFLCVWLQTFQYWNFTGTYEIPQDYALGILGFANSATLLNFFWCIAVFTAFQGKILNWIQSGIFFLTALLSSYLTGIVASLAAFPFFLFTIPYVKIGEKKTFSLFQRLVIIFLVMVAGLAAYAIYVQFNPSNAQKYITMIMGYPIGFLSGLEITLKYFFNHPWEIVFGLGPGLVNSREVVRTGISRLPTLVLPYINEFTGEYIAPSTYRVMNQSYLIAFAETGLLGLLCLGGFWFSLLKHTLRSINLVYQRHRDMIILRCVHFSMISFFILGIVSDWWGESPLVYLMMIVCAPILLRTQSQQATVV